MLLNCGVGKDSWECLGQQDQTSQSWRKSTLNIHWKDWCQSSSTLATWCKELTHWKRSWCWERLRAREGWDRGWDGWMASATQWAWVWVSSVRKWRAGSLACCSSWRHKELDMTWRLNNSNKTMWPRLPLMLASKTHLCLITECKRPLSLIIFLLLDP